MMKSFVLLVLALPASYAGAESIVGNGGDVVVCRDANREIRSVELLDYVEARLRGWEVTEAVASDAEIVTARMMIQRLAVGLPEESAELDAIAAAFFDNARLLPNIDLVDIPDSDHLVLPRGCALEQIAIRRRPGFPSERLYTVNLDLWERLAPSHRVGLILHETLYGYFLDKPVTSSSASASVRARYLTGLLSRRDFDRIAPIDLALELRSVGFQRWQVAPGASVDLRTMEATEPDRRWGPTWVVNLEASYSLKLANGYIASASSEWVNRAWLDDRLRLRRLEGPLRWNIGSGVDGAWWGGDCQDPKFSMEAEFSEAGDLHRLRSREHFSGHDSSYCSASYRTPDYRVELRSFWVKTSRTSIEWIEDGRWITREGLLARYPSHFKTLRVFAKPETPRALYAVWLAAPSLPRDVDRILEIEGVASGFGCLKLRPSKGDVRAFQFCDVPWIGVWGLRLKPRGDGFAPADFELVGDDEACRKLGWSLGDRSDCLPDRAEAFEYQQSRHFDWGRVEAEVRVPLRVDSPVKGRILGRETGWDIRLDANVGTTIKAFGARWPWRPGAALPEWGAKVDRWALSAGRVEIAPEASLVFGAGDYSPAQLATWETNRGSAFKLSLQGKTFAFEGLGMVRRDYEGNVMGFALREKVTLRVHRGLPREYPAGTRFNLHTGTGRLEKLP